MRTSLSRDSTTPPATERQASFFMAPGIVALEGGMVLQGRMRGRLSVNRKG